MTSCLVNKVTWVVEDIDKVRAAWVALGLSDIEEYPNIQLVGQYHGKPVTIYAWQITAHLGNLTVDMIQPAEAQANAYASFLSKHGDGILSMVHEVPSPQALEKEILRMKGKGVEVLQKVTMQRGKSSLTYTYFDTEPEGKFALGMVYGWKSSGRRQGRPWCRTSAQWCGTHPPCRLTGSGWDSRHSRCSMRRRGRIPMSGSPRRRARQISMRTT